jgi:hypothetical protein
MVEIARRWGGYLDVFELVNEPFWVDANAMPMELVDMVRLCHAAALAVKDTAPDARLAVNFAEVSRTSTYAVRPQDFLEALDRAGVPFDLIGLQAFENGYTVTAPPTYYRAKTLAGIIQSIRSYARVGKPLEISALCVPSIPPPDSSPSYFAVPYGVWDEDLQARYLETAYTMLFAQPEVEGITWWCAVDGKCALMPGGGLLRDDHTPKPVYAALKRWTRRHTSSGQVYTDDEGKAVVRGHAGEYDVDIGSGAVSRGLDYAIEPRVVSDVTVVLDYQP